MQSYAKPMALQVQKQDDEVLISPVHRRPKDATSPVSHHTSDEAKSEELKNVTARDQRHAMRKLTRYSRLDIQQYDLWFAIDLRWVESWIRFTSFHIDDEQLAECVDSERNESHQQPKAIDYSSLRGMRR